MRHVDKKQYTFHGFDMVLKRTEINSSELKMLSRYAVKNGINFDEIPPGPLKGFVGRKMAKGHKRIKLYRGYVFIFFNSSHRIITCYPIPDYYIDEYNKVKDQVRIKRNER